MTKKHKLIYKVDELIKEYPNEVLDVSNICKQMNEAEYAIVLNILSDNTDNPMTLVSMGGNPETLANYLVSAKEKDPIVNILLLAYLQSLKEEQNHDIEQLSNLAIDLLTILKEFNLLDAFLIIADRDSTNIKSTITNDIDKLANYCYDLFTDYPPLLSVFIDTITETYINDPKK